MCKKLICLMSFALLVGLNAPVRAVVVTVDENTRYQTIEGWGACAGMEVLTTDARAKDAYKYLGCNLLRIAFEPCMLMAEGGNLEGPEVPLTGDLQTDAPKFNFEHSRTDHWDDVAIWLVNNALEPQRVKLVASPWSVPHWAKAPTGAKIEQQRWRGVTPLIMYCDECDTAGGTWDTGIYQQDRYPYCARFMSAACYGFEEHAGVTLYGLSIQNEVAFENPFNSCTLYHIPKAQKVESETIMDYNIYANALKAVKDEWAVQPEVQHIKIMGPHHSGLDEKPDNPWGLLFQMKGIEAVKNHSDAQLIDFLEIYTHNYGAPPAKRAEMFRAYWEGYTSMPDEPWAEWTYGPGIQYDGKQTWNSEFGGHSPDWGGALDLASDLHTQMVWGNESGIIHWAFCEGSFTVHNLLSTGQLDNPHTSPKYSTFKQFSRYIRPGAERVDATFADGSTSYGTGDPMDAEVALSVSAYVHDTDERATIVLVNMLTSDQPVTINVPATPSVTVYEVYLSQSGAAEGFVQQSNLAVSNGQVSLTVPASSVVTLTGTPATGTPPGQASNPSPADGATGVAINADLSWTAGSGADSHDVYFGTSTTPPFQGNQTQTTFDPGIMAESTTYHWRIDEINVYGTTTGVLWSFTTGAGCTPSTMHVDDIVCGTTNQGAGCYSAWADVTIKDDCGVAVQGAAVTGTFTKPSETVIGYTNSQGVVHLETSGCDHNVHGTFCVDNVADTLPYDSGDNIETCDTY